MFLTFRAKNFGGERGGGGFILVLVVCFAVARGFLGVGVFVGGREVVRKGREGEGKEREGREGLICLLWRLFGFRDTGCEPNPPPPQLPIPSSPLPFFYVPPPLTRFTSSNKNIPIPIPIPKPASHDSPHALANNPDIDNGNTSLSSREYGPL